MVSLKTSTLRPGLLVSLKTSVRGNVSYVKETIEGDTEIAPGKHRAKWETTRTIQDAAEHEAAVAVRGKARALISAKCAKSEFGLLCPDTNVGEFNEAVTEAEDLVRKFNLSSNLTTVGVYVVTGQVSPDDARAIKAIKSEIADLMETMTSGIQSLDVNGIREAANRAKSVAQMLSPSAAAEVQLAVETARSAARKIVKAGEAAAQEIDMLAVRRITEARGAFLDLDGADEVVAPSEVGRGIDLVPEAPEDGKAVAPVQAALALEF